VPGVRLVSDPVNGLEVPLPAASEGVVSAEFVAYLKPVADTAAPPVAVMVAFSVAALEVTDVAESVSTVGATAFVVNVIVSP
jgi:hypothetical protein